MKIKLRTKVFISLIILINLISTIAFAAESKYSVGMSLTSNSKLKEGETVIITVNLTNINAGEGIDSIKAKINYDKNVFEEITVSNFTSANSWNPSYIPSNDNATFIKSNGIRATVAEAVATLNLKVKSSINVDSTTITFTNLVVSGGLPNMGGTGNIQVNDISVTINKDKDASSSTEEPNDNNTSLDGNIVDNDNGNTTNNSGINNSNTNSGNKNTKNTIKDNTITKTSTLPKAGLEQYGIVAIIAVLVIAIGSYILYKRYEKNVK